MDRLNLILFIGNSEMIDRELATRVIELLDDKASQPADQTVIDIWIDSAGGDAHAAFKIYRELRSRCRELRAVVPDYAKSAATLLAIGCDIVFASASADFGPLDVQVEHPDRENRVVSALAGANALEHLANLGVDLMLTMGQKIVYATNLPKAEVVKNLLVYSSDILKPVLSKLDPQLIHEAAEQLRVTRQYAEIMLRSKRSPMDERQAKSVAKALVTQYPTHGFVIDLHELQRLGIQCAPIDQHPLAARIKGLHKKFSRDGRSIVELLRIDGGI